MAYDAYSLPPSDSFRVVPGWNLSDGFGWSEDGIRGYVFASFEDTKSHSEEDGEVLVVSIKGTSPGAFGVGGPTSGRDKLNVSPLAETFLEKWLRRTGNREYRRTLG